jgi:hypothetical protein
VRRRRRLRREGGGGRRVRSEEISLCECLFEFGWLGEGGVWVGVGDAYTWRMNR